MWDFVSRCVVVVPDCCVYGTLCRGRWSHDLWRHATVDIRSAPIDLREESSPTIRKKDLKISSFKDKLKPIANDTQ